MKPLAAPGSRNRPVSSVEVRRRLTAALELDLVGPRHDHALAAEKLPGWIRPSNWYLTGFLIPSGTSPARAADDDEEDEFELVPESVGLTEESNDERKAAKKGFFPSSMGLSFLVPKESEKLDVTVRWGDYAQADLKVADKSEMIWERSPREVTVPVSVEDTDTAMAHKVPGSGGLELHVVVRPVASQNIEQHIPAGTRSISVFLVNRRAPVATADGEADVSYVFQSSLEVRSEQPFVPRPNLRGMHAADWDEQVADLHYAGTPEYATGHGVSGDWDVAEGTCRMVRTTWLPTAEVEKTVTLDVHGVELSMDALGQLEHSEDVDASLRPLVKEYRAWIEQQRQHLPKLDGARGNTASELLRFAGIAADRIEQGIEILQQDPAVLDAFRMANRSVSHALKKRLSIDTPRWHAFQLAFILLNLPGLADPTDPHRNTVDLLFSDGRRQDRSLFGVVGLRDGAEALETSWRKGAPWFRCQRHHEVHPPAIDARSTWACCRPCLCVGTGACEGSGSVRAVAFRNRSLGR